MSSVIDLEEYKKNKKLLSQVGKTEGLPVKDIMESLVSIVLQQAELLEVMNNNMSLLVDKTKQTEVQFIAVSAQALAVVETLVEKNVSDAQDMQAKYEEILERHLKIEE